MLIHSTRCVAETLSDSVCPQLGLKRTASAVPLPLTTSKFVNRMGLPPTVSHLHHTDPPTYFYGTDTKKRTMEKSEKTPVDQLLAKLTEQQERLARQKRSFEETQNENRSNSSSATDPYANTPPTETNTSDGRPDAVEVFRLKKELEAAKERMAQMDLQITQSRLAQHTMEEAIGSPFPAAQHLAANITGHSMMPGGAGLAQSNPYSRAASPFEHGSFNMPRQQS